MVVKIKDTFERPAWWVVKKYALIFSHKLNSEGVRFLFIALGQIFRTDR